VILKLSLEVICSFVLSSGGFFLLSVISDKLQLGVGLWGDKGPALFSLFLGLSIGGTLGVVLIDKIVYRRHRLSAIAIVTAMFSGIIGIFVGIVVILDKMGGGFLSYMPLVVAPMCVLGYNIGTLLMRNRNF
jgi:hypothetical protein